MRTITVSPVVALFAACAVFWTLHRLFCAWQLSKRHSKFADTHGCQKPPAIAGGILGLAEWWELVKASRQGEGLTHLIARFDYSYTHTVRFLSQEIIATAEPQNAKTILATSFNDFEIGQRRRTTFAPVLGDGIFTLDGAGWEHSRALLRPQFVRAQIRDLDSLEMHVQRLISRLITTTGPTDEAVDLQPMFSCLTLDTATEFLFGESANSQLGNPHRPGEQAFGKNFDLAQEWLVMRSRSQGLRFLVGRSSYRRAAKEVHAFVDRYVEQELRSVKKPPQNPPGRYVFISALAEETRDPRVLRDQAIQILLAGRDTTAATLGWACYLLARHPKVYQKLRREVLQAFPPGAANPSYEGLKDLVYLRHVINEVLRLYPSVPINTRVAVRDTILPCGGGPSGDAPVFVAKGQPVQYSVFAMHRRKDIYGEDALEFNPDRWESKSIGRHWEYLPFNGGPRICVSSILPDPS